MARKQKTISAKTSEPKQVKITAAKGRPMLTWVGKRPLSHVTAFPAQRVERHDALAILGMDGPLPDDPEQDIKFQLHRIQTLRDLGSQWNRDCWKDQPVLDYAMPEQGGLLFHGDNKDVLAFLLANGFRRSVNLIYIDPPFDSGADYVRKVNLRGPKGTAKLDGEGYALGEQIQYTDIWTNDNYLQFMYERLLLMKELLAENGSIAVHCDARRSHYLRIMLDEVFGSDNFRGEIVVRAGVKNVQSQFEEMTNLTLGNNVVLLFAKGKDTKYPTLKGVAEEYEPGKWDTFWRGTDRHTMRYELFGKIPEHGQWRWESSRANAAIANYATYSKQFVDDKHLDEHYLRALEKGEDLDFVRLSNDGVVQYYIPPRKYKILSNVWMDIPYRGTQTDYPTEKNEAIAERLIAWLTRSGELVVDCFGGSGTVPAVAQRLGRRWIGCDINKGAIQTTAKRLRAIVDEQIQAALKAAERQRQGQLPGIAEDDGETPPKPAQFGFTVWRVNDYDLQIQHNEAVNLACEHIGVERTRTDSYFDGTRGKSLVKIIPFSHPLSPLDLEEVKRELEARPDEDRNITVVCLGIELAAKAWVDDWNRLRKPDKHNKTLNKIAVIELRTDAKYGKFIKHEPARGKVNIARAKGKITVEIQDFISPTILERLDQQSGLLKPKIDDWRAMVDCVMIDAAYDGTVFNVVLADVPEKKIDMVAGRYEIAAPGKRTAVAVKIIDMLGEEVLVVEK
jgi:DNA modification methylase